MPYVYIEADYNGNIYLRFKDQAYNVLLDALNLTLAPLTPDARNALRSIMLDHPHLKMHTKMGKVILSDITLKGRVSKVLKNMDQDEDAEHAESNSFASVSSFIEEEFYRIQKIPNSSTGSDYDLDSDSDDMDDRYIFCDLQDMQEQEQKQRQTEQTDTETGIKLWPYIVFSDMLNDCMAHYDTLMIKGGTSSKIVTSCVQNQCTYNSCRIVFYSDGVVKIHYPGSCSVYSKICIKDGGITLDRIKTEADTSAIQNDE
jgi:hypothetical protein